MMTVDEFLNEWHSESNYVIGHTSGSTGKPKEIKLLKADMRASANLTNNFFGITKDSVLMLCLSPDYIAGKMMIVRAEEAHARLLTEKPSNHPLEQHDGPTIDLLAIVPSQALWLVDHPNLLKCVRNIIVGGGEIHSELRKKLSSLSSRVYATYGMTETCSHVALSRISETPQPFRALPPVTFEQDERNCLVINTPQFSFEKLATNDIVDLIDNTTFYWRGRFDNVINTGGIKVFPEEIERLISPMIDRRFYITSSPSEKWGQEVIIKIEGEPMSKTEQDELMAKMSIVLSAYQRPKGMIFLHKFTETATGKVKRL